MDNSEEISEKEKCIRQLALIVARNVKFHLSLQKAGLFTAKNVIGKEGQEGFSFFWRFFYFLLFFLNKIIVPIAQTKNISGDTKIAIIKNPA